MLTTPVFWRIFALLAAMAFLSLAAGAVLCAMPATAEGPELVAWRWKCVGAVSVVLLGALFVTRTILNHFAGPLGALTRATEKLAEGAVAFEFSAEDSEEPTEIAAVLERVSQQVVARIAHLKSEQLRLAQSHERLAVVLEAMVEGVISIDLDERILLANAAAMRLLDLKPVRLAHPLWESVRLPRLQELVRQCVAGEDQQRVEFDVPRTQSTVAAVVTRLPGDPCPGVVVVLHDVTDLRRLENLKREFVSNVSHELKTPLAAISAYTETLLDGALEDPNINRTFVSRIEEQAERLNSLIRDLLELARIETLELAEADVNENPQDMEPVDVSEILQQSAAAHQDVARSKDLTFVVHPSDEALWGLGDPGGIRTIADNLIDNAINYTPQGGRVEIRWWHEANWATFEVSDTGVGIAKEHQTRIFERFFRVDRARSREVGGTGLGLAIVKHLCQVYDGEIRLTSRPGHGSTFTVRLRAAAPVEIETPAGLNAARD